MTVAPVPLQKQMRVSEILRGAITVYRHNVRAFMAISVVIVPFRLASIALHMSSTPARAGLDLLLTLSATVAWLCAAAAVAFAVATTADGFSINIARCCKRSVDHLGSLVFAELRVVGVILLIVFLWAIVAIPSLIGLHRQALVFVVPLGAIALCITAYFSVRWAFVIQAVIIEETDAAGALSMSASIVRGAWRHTCAVVGLLWIFRFVFGAPATAISWTVSYPVGQVLALAVAVVIAPFSVAATTLLFFDLQSRERERVSIA
jgi:hypothetical protein